jgi:hypothetical protein
MATTTNNGWVTPDNTAYVKDGASAIRSLGQSIDTSVGTGLLAWTAYTPTLTAVTVGNGTLTAKYLKLGKTLHIMINFTLGSTSAVGSQPQFSLPAGLTTTFPLFQPVGVGNISISGGQYNTQVFTYTSSAIYPLLQTANTTYVGIADVTATVPATFNNGSVISLRALVEVV